MWRRSYFQFNIRAQGYVFWRENVCRNLDGVIKSYVSQTKPIPIAEISRRMVRIKTKYENTNDTQERTLLRGEYKYFSGKICNIFASRSSDCIAYLQCASFFGFWDTAQVESIVLSLRRRIDELTANEMYIIFISLVGLRKETDELYIELARRLINHVSELTTQECVDISTACELSKVPAVLLQNLFRAIEKNVETLTASQTVDLLDHLSAAPVKVKLAFPSIIDVVTQRLYQILIAQQTGDNSNMPDLLTAADAATAFYSLTCDMHNHEYDKLLQVLLNYFISIEYNCDARSIAILFSGLSVLHEETTCNSVSIGMILQATKELSKRVLFLSTDLSTTELINVYKLYLHCFSEVLELSTEHTEEEEMEYTQKKELQEQCHEHEEYQKIENSCLHDGRGNTHSSSSSRIKNEYSEQILNVHLEQKEKTIAMELKDKELAIIEERLQELVFVLRALSEHMINILQNSSANVSQADLLTILQMFSHFVSNTLISKNLIFLLCKRGCYEPTSYANTKNTSMQECNLLLCNAQTLIIEVIPELHSILEHIANKIIANIRNWSLPIILDVLVMSNNIGTKLIKDALFTCVLNELAKHVDKIDNRQIEATKVILSSLSNLRLEHERKIHMVILPALQRARESFYIAIISQV